VGAKRRRDARSRRLHSWLPKLETSLFTTQYSSLSTQYSVLITLPLTHHDNLVINLLHSVNRPNGFVDLRFERLTFDDAG
jgi:hypothetical protein